ncbi:MAG: DEXDc helicase [Harvfovirus sp.]|uniref:DEXDc helicase n=1 Tax=Harvfovirus sp. TaxID=2487768 RepID=A0A3G5A4M1_9VIRU|nr:MAG: DEXDc helicase [Harvfovirus sp.]
MKSNYVNVVGGVAPVLEKEIMTFPHKCDDFQKHAFFSIACGENLLATAHTGSGKTVIAEYAIVHTILNTGKNVVYTSPIKSLSNEKYNDFKKKFAQYPEIRLGILTGDNKINPDGNCLIMTAEILRNALYRLKVDPEKGESRYELKKSVIDKLGCVIIDEVHFITDPDRGKVWEETLVLLDRDVNLIMLSATIDKPEVFAQWIGEIKNKKINLISTSHRVVPLRHYIYAGEKRYLIFDDAYDHASYIDAYKAHNNHLTFKKRNGRNNYNVNDLVKYLKKEKLLQAIFFSFYKKNCEEYAGGVCEALVQSEEIAQIKEIFSKYLNKYEKQYERLEQFQIVKGLVLKGIAFHHSGLLPVLKEIVEILFHMGLVKVLFATETFAVGVNMPTRTVVFMELEKFTSERGGGRRSLTASEYKQMSGRAGRRGIDVRGEVIIFPMFEFPEDKLLRELLLGKAAKIISKFKIDYQFFLRVIQSDAISIDDFLNNSLQGREIRKMISEGERELEVLGKEEVSVLGFDEKIIELYRLCEGGENGLGGQVKFVMGGKQMKYLKKLKGEVLGNEEGRKGYEEYCMRMKMSKKIGELEDSVKMWSKYSERVLQGVVRLLKEGGFIGEGGEILKRGVIAAQINECNSCLLTEMICGGYFVGLEAAEIVGMLAIFVDDGKIEDRISLSEVVATKKMKEYLEDFSGVVEEYQYLEQSIGIEQCDDKYWAISYDFIDSAYLWACGADLGKIFAREDMYIGNFIRNMIKINNIAKDLIHLCELDGDISVIPTLSKIESLVMKDFVTVNSLYLS